MKPLNIQWSLCYNFIHAYFIKFSIEKIGLNTILTSQFQTYLFPTFIIPKFLKFCSWFTINPIEGSIVSKWNVSKIWIYFLVFLWKTAYFLTWYFFGNFFCILYHVFTPLSKTYISKSFSILVFSIMHVFLFIFSGFSLAYYFGTYFLEVILLFVYVVHEINVTVVNNVNAIDRRYGHEKLMNKKTYLMSL